MAGLTVKHVFQSAKGDGVDATLVQPSNWNATHDLEMDSGNILGRKTAGAGPVEQLSPADAATLIGAATTAYVTANSQPLDADLTALAALAATAGLLARTGANAFAPRTLTAGAGITVTNGDGASANPTVATLAPLKGVQAFTTGSGTYTPSANARGAIVFVTGGGGGGGGAASTTASAGAGGGAATAVAFVSSLDSVAYVVDPGGAAGSTAGGTGGAGGTSSFGAITAGGGSGGVGSNSPSNTTSAAGGAGSSTTANATFTIPGSTGGFGFVDNAAGVGIDWSGAGGGSFWGMGGAGRPTDNLGAGVAGVVPGSGGGGANRNATNVAGGVGAPGIIIVIEF